MASLAVTNFFVQILMNLDFSETVREKFKQEKVDTLHATSPLQINLHELRSKLCKLS